MELVDEETALRPEPCDRRGAPSRRRLRRTTLRSDPGGRRFLRGAGVKKCACFLGSGLSFHVPALVPEGLRERARDPHCPREPREWDEIMQTCSRARRSRVSRNSRSLPRLDPSGTKRSTVTTSARIHPPDLVGRMVGGENPLTRRRVATRRASATNIRRISRSSVRGGFAPARSVVLMTTRPQPNHARHRPCARSPSRACSPSVAS
jgi:hypothetical protein